LRAGALCVQVDEGVEFRLQGGDTAQMSVDKLYRRKFLGTDGCCDFGDRGERGEAGHKKIARLCPGRDAGQARSGSSEEAAIKQVDLAEDSRENFKIPLSRMNSSAAAALQADREERSSCTR